jgi:hypothetical protein
LKPTPIKLNNIILTITIDPVNPRQQWNFYPRGLILKGQCHDIRGKNEKTWLLKKSMLLYFVYLHVSLRTPQQKKYIPFFRDRGASSWM